MLGGEVRRELLAVRLDQVPDPEHDLGALRERRRAPARERGLGRGDRGTDLLDRGEVDVLRQATGRRVVDRTLAAGRAGDAAPADPVADPTWCRGVRSDRARLCDLRHREDLSRGVARTATRLCRTVTILRRGQPPGGRPAARPLGRPPRPSADRRDPARTGGCRPALPRRRSRPSRARRGRGTPPRTRSRPPRAIRVPALSSPTTAGSRQVSETAARTSAHSARAASRIRPSRAAPPAGREDQPDDQRQGQGREALVGLRGVGRQGRRERRPRPRSEEGRRPRQGDRLALPRPAEEHRELARPEHEEDRERDEVHPAPDRDLQERRDGQAAQEPAHDGETQLEAAASGVEEDAGLRRVVVEVQQAVPDPTADHRARDDADGDEQQVVGPQRGAPRHQPHDDERGDDDRRDRDRLPAHDEAATRWSSGSKSSAMRAIGTVLGSVSGARRRGGRRRRRGVGWPTPPVSPTGSSGGHDADIIGP